MSISVASVANTSPIGFVAIDNVLTMASSTIENMQTISATGTIGGLIIEATVRGFGVATFGYLGFGGY